jgi:uncharacterized membrane protein
MSAPRLPFRHSDLVLAVLPPLCMAAGALATKSFWGDEILSLQFASAAPDEVLAVLARDYHPPLYFLLLRGWLALWGDGEAGLRLFQALQGMLFTGSTLALFRAVFPRRRWHPACLLFLLSVPLWLFLPMLRYYALAAGLAVLSTVLLLRWTAAPGMRRTMMLGATYLALLYTDYPSSFVILAHAGLVAWKHRAVAWRYGVILAACAIAFLPWMLVVAGQIARLADTSRTADLNTGPAAVLLKVGYSLYAFLIGETIYPVEPAGIAALLALTTLLALFLRGVRALPPTALEWFFPAAAVFGVLCTALVTTFLSRHTSFIYTPPRTLYALPFAAVGIGVMLDRIAARGPRLLLTALLASVSLYGCVNVLANRHFFMPVYAVPWKAIVEETRGARGLLLSDERLCFAYYARRDTAGLPALVAPADAAELRVLLRHSLTRGNTLFLLLTERESTPSDIPADVLTALRDSLTRVSRRVFVPYDDTYRWIRSRLLKRAGGEGKATLERYDL